MIIIVILHMALALIILVLRRSLGRRAFFVGALGPIGLLAWSVLNTAAILDGEPVREVLEWVPALNLSLVFAVDGYALLFLYVISVAGTAIFLYAATYFGNDVKVATFAGVMTAFGGAMVGLVGSDHLLGVFLFWELTTITSYFLIGYADHTAEARSAALHAALVTSAGGLAMLGGLVLLADQSGSFLISEIVANPPEASPLVGGAWALILLGAVTKSAQFPFHGWLPGAMAAPTPASAFLHSATMVKAGIFLVGRLAPAALVGAAWWQDTVMAIGFVTMVLGGWQALRQHDLKLMLAFGTVSQLGFLFLLMGAGKDKLAFGGLALLSAHALFKATLFMVVGVIDHEAGTRDLRRLHGLRSAMPGVFWMAVAASASMAAVPLTFGFAAKEAAFDGLASKGLPYLAAAAIASIITVAYTGRFLVGAFGPSHPGHEPAGAGVHTPRNALTFAPAVPAIGGLVLGLVPGAVKPLVDAATAAVYAVGGAGKLVAWPGFVTPLWFSLASLAIGLTLVFRPAVVDAATATVGRLPLPTAEGSFRRSVAGLLNFADKSSSILQNGSLPSYLGIITLVAVVLPSTAFIGGMSGLRLPAQGGVIEWLLAAVILASAVAVVFIRRRFATVILLGGVGYGIAGFFTLLGAPDLALTQLLVETLAIALFALVLRHLPTAFTEPGSGQVPKIAVAMAVTLFVFVGALVTTSTRRDEPVSAAFLEDSLSVAGGANVVNVILVDFRGFDTLGEITVLAVAMVGAARLVEPLLRKKERT
ncbi:MAG: hydrogen gas-evolving membrane-bound hydrogenase subunit E [Acidimicrobiia bacterium]